MEPAPSGAGARGDVLDWAMLGRCARALCCDCAQSDNNRQQRPSLTLPPLSVVTKQPTTITTPTQRMFREFTPSWCALKEGVGRVCSELCNV
jgi:hypothetical protein